MISSDLIKWFNCLIIVSFLCCTTEETIKPSDFEIRIRIPFEPDRLNPMLSRQTTATQIEKLIFCPLEDYDPWTLNLEPVLLEAKPEIVPIDTGQHTGGTMLAMRIREDATWDNGFPVTGMDYLFTMKTALNPYLANSSWAGFVSIIKDIQVDSSDLKRITVIIDKQYILGEEVVCGFAVYPEHIYDSLLNLRHIQFEHLLQGQMSLTREQDLILSRFAESFNDVVFSRNTVQGCGPYSLISWESNRQIILKRKENWWGDAIKDPHPLLVANPGQIIYYFIPDEQTALTSFKDGRFDVLTDIDPDLFNDLIRFKGGESFTLETPTILQYYYIAYNNLNPVLQDSRVRRALSHLMDVDQVIDQLFYGKAQKIVSPIHPSKSYYDNSLLPLEFDLEAAKSLLAEAGWRDHDKDGRLENPDLGMTQMKLDILTTPSQLSQDVAIIFKEQASRVGIEVQIVPHEFRILLQKVRQQEFDLACLASRQSNGLYDPYPSWHSDNISGTGNNYCGFSNQENDQIIEQLRTTLDHDELTDLYKRFQSIIYREQPAMFLVAPQTRIAVNDRFQFKASVIRPGYFENTFSLN